MQSNQFTFSCQRKHFLKDKTYNLYLQPQRFIMTDGDQKSPPKYAVELDHQNCIVWRMDAANQLEAFGIKYNQQVKWFYADSRDLRGFQHRLAASIFQGNISYFYESVTLLGSGASCKVYKVKHAATNIHYASKCIRRDYLFQKKNDFERYKRLINEIEIISVLSHQNIVKLIETYEGDNSYYLILELLEGQTLQTYIRKHQYEMDYSMMRQIIKQILQSLAYLDQKKVIHRDIKPDNIVLKSSDDLSVIKLIDFGLATYANTDTLGLCGTPGYIAPEVFLMDEHNKYHYDTKVDVFSAGAILYKMAARRNLFQGRNSEEVLQKNKHCQIDINTLYALQLPIELIDLLTGLLQYYPQTRMSAAEALQHRFFTDQISIYDDRFRRVETENYDVAQEEPRVTVPQTQLIKASFSQRRIHITTEYSVREIPIINGIADNFEARTSYHPSFAANSFESFISNQSGKMLQMQKSDHILEREDSDNILESQI